MSEPDKRRSAVPESWRSAILQAIDARATRALELARWMAAHPELSLAEHETSARYIAELGAQGFAIERGVAGMETAFLARHGAKTAPYCVALLAEMDALPGIGHACGHNLSGPASILAAEAVASALPPDAVRLLVVGSPAEETGVGKKRLVDAGVFAEADAAMMAHASDMRRAHRLFLGNRKFEFVYHGRAAHAAAYPERGINALDGVISLFVNVGLLRQQLPPGVRIHGIVSDGGEAPNIIPERAAARFWVRALADDQLADAATRLVLCAEGAAAGTGTRLSVGEQAGTSPPMRANLPLADSYRRQLELLDLPETAHAPADSIGSSDITHLSRVLPTIHPNFPIGSNLQLHTREFAEATQRPMGEEGLLEAARALALTIAELAAVPQVRAAVRDASS